MLDSMADGTENVTVQILREIRDELSRLRGDTNFRLEGLNGRLEELRGVVQRNGERFKHFLAAEGDIIRDLKTRMTRVEQHLGIGE